jgi:Right handed beta helix region
MPGGQNKSDKNTTETLKERNMKTTKTIILAALATLLIAAPALADIYIYVDDSGSDTSGDGSQGNPYATIQTAVDEVPNIITQNYAILVDAGTYREQVDIYNKRCLGPNASLTIEGDTTTPSNVCVTGADSGAETTAVRDVAFYVVGSDNVYINGVLVNYCAEYGMYFKQSILCEVNYCELKNNSTNTGAGIFITQLAKVLISNCTCDYNVTGVYVLYNSFASVLDSSCSNNSSFGICGRYGAYINAKDNKCNSNGIYGIYGYASGSMEATNNYSDAGCENGSYGIYAAHSSVINYSGTTPKGTPTPANDTDSGTGGEVF